jgi:hypothetical protein
MTQIYADERRLHEPQTGLKILGLVNTPAIISLDAEGRVRLRFTNVRNDELSVTIRAKKKSAK